MSITSPNLGPELSAADLSLKPGRRRVDGAMRWFFLAAAVTTFAVVLVLAWLSWNLVESPAIRMKKPAFRFKECIHSGIDRLTRENKKVIHVDKNNSQF